MVFENMFADHGTFELIVSDNDWERLKTNPRQLEVERETMTLKYGSRWLVPRNPLTRVFPFEDAQGSKMVYIGTELPDACNDDCPSDFVKWLLLFLGVVPTRIENTSTFKLNSLRYKTQAYNKDKQVLSIGDSFFQPHYLTASGISNVYRQLTDLKLTGINNPNELNEKLSNQRNTYFQKVQQMLINPNEAGPLFFQA